MPVPLDDPPLPVEITNHTDWWQPWLPFAGSALLFIGAMITLWLTNRGADKREVAKWRRDTLLHLCSDAVVAALEIEALYQSATSPPPRVRQTTVLWGLPRPSPENAQANKEAAAATTKIGSIAEQLRLMSATALAGVGKRMEEAALALDVPARNLSAALRAAAQAEAQVSIRLKNTRVPEDPAVPYRVRYLTDEERNAEFEREKLKIWEETVKGPQSAYNQAIDHFATVRGLFIAAGQGELNPAAAQTAAQHSADPRPHY